MTMLGYIHQYQNIGVKIYGGCPDPESQEHFWINQIEKNSGSTHEEMNV